LNESPAPYAKLIVCGGDCSIGGLVEVSLIVTLLLVATIVPVGLPVRTETVKVSGPSVKESSIGVILNDPVLLLIVKDPEVALKSAPILVT
jgi:hypothetical protein